MRRVNNNQRRRLRQNTEARPLMRRIISNMLFDWWYFYVSPGFPKVRKIIRFCAGASMGMGFIAAAVFLFFGTEAGHLEAKFDLWRHHYEIRTYTSDRSHVAAYRELLKTYGITYRRVSISAFNPFTTNHFEAYNRTMKKGIRRKLDLDVESLFRFFQILEMIESDSDTKIWTSPATLPFRASITLGKLGFHSCLPAADRAIDIFVTPPETVSKNRIFVQFRGGASVLKRRHTLVC